MKKLIILTLFLSLFCHGLPAWGGEATTVVKGAIDGSLKILSDPRFQAKDQKEAQREQIWGLIRGIFDFTEVSKRALARNWRLFSPTEKEAFTIAFSELLGNTYIDKIQTGFNNDKVDYLSEDLISDTKVLVKTKIIREMYEIPIDYKLSNKSGDWKVYDISVEGVSLVKNYRSQFRKYLSKKKPGQLIQRLKDKTARQKKKRQALYRVPLKWRNTFGMNSDDQWKAA